MARLNSLFTAFLTIAASTQKLGINLIRVAILVIFVWIGGLKFWNYEAEGIVPFVANSPFMSFFYTNIIRKSKFPQNPKRSVRFSGKRTKRSVQKRKARNTQKAETKVL